jgi:hypothetical protein
VVPVEAHNSLHHVPNLPAEEELVTADIHSRFWDERMKYSIVIPKARSSAFSETKQKATTKLPARQKTN